MTLPQVVFAPHPTNTVMLSPCVVNTHVHLNSVDLTNQTMCLLRKIVEHQFLMYALKSPVHYFLLETRIKNAMMIVKMAI